MWTIFAFENLFFAINIFCGLVLFSVAWLYYDAYSELNIKRDLWKIIGFVLLGLAFMARGLDLRNIVLSQNIDIYLRIFGYLLLIIGLIVDPLQKKPKLSAFLFTATLPALFYLPPVLSAIVALLYLRRASVGLERHLYPPAISFFLISLYELMYSLNNFRPSTNLNIFNLLAPYGLVWGVNLALLFLGFLILGRWVFKYLLKQFQSQLFMVTMGLVLSIYLIVTVTFTGLLLNNLKLQILHELSSQSKVLDFALNSKKAELLSDSKLVSKSDLSNIDNSSFNIKHDTFVVFDKDGVVTFRAEDNERKGDSILDDPLVKRILDGKESSNIVVKDGVVAPLVSVVSGSPIEKEGKVTGGVLIGDLIDNSYLEGFSKLTGLSAAIYGGDILSAGGTIGTKEANQEIKEKVLTKGESFSSENRWLNRSFLSVYSPLLNVEGNPVGMVFVGRPQVEVLNLASKTLESIFLGTIVLLILSMIPAKIIANSISKQIK